MNIKMCPLGMHAIVIKCTRKQAVLMCPLGMHAIVIKCTRKQAVVMSACLDESGLSLGPTEPALVYDGLLQAEIANTNDRQRTMTSIKWTVIVIIQRCMSSYNHRAMTGVVV